MRALIRHRQQRIIVEQFALSHIDYEAAFLHAYASFNAWYRFATGEPLNSLALQALKQRYELWHDYFTGECLTLLRSPMRRIYVLTQHRPLKTADGRSICLRDDSDWQQLIDFWFIVRCDVVHATDSLDHAYYQQYVKLAYESLSVYMTEVVRRLNVRLNLEDVKNSDGTEAAILSPIASDIDLYPRVRFRAIERARYH